MKTKTQKSKNSETATGESLKDLFKKTFGETAIEFKKLKGDGSSRNIYRLKGGTKKVIGIFGPDKSENRAFLEFSQTFAERGMPVPKIYAQDRAKNIYLEEDLGDTTLFDFSNSRRKSFQFPAEAVKMYKKAIKYLPKFQIKTGKFLNYNYCYPRKSFDKQSIMWDLNYFKYYFLKLGGVSFNEHKLENDFNLFSDFLLKAKRDFFLYRDFQSRNIMIKNSKPAFIDYQGGRKGALQYDIASLLYDSKADIPARTRKELLEYYLSVLRKEIKINKNEFNFYYPAYCYIRIMQAMGAYGLRGFYEKKTHFLESIPYAVRNIEYLLNHSTLPLKIPELTKVFKNITASSRLRQFGGAKMNLTARVQSFSYRREMPYDDRGHGGGFVFDCRALPNPGKFPKYARFTGKDLEIIKFLKEKSEVKKFLNAAFAIIKQSVENYLKRNFTDLMITFGCTGGRHRSVYCAEEMKKRLEKIKKVKVELNHREID